MANGTFVCAGRYLLPTLFTFLMTTLFTNPNSVNRGANDTLDELKGGHLDGGLNIVTSLSTNEDLMHHVQTRTQRSASLSKAIVKTIETWETPAESTGFGSGAQTNNIQLKTDTSVLPSADFSPAAGNPLSESSSTFPETVEFSSKPAETVEFSSTPAETAVFSGTAAEIAEFSSTPAETAESYCSPAEVTESLSTPRKVAEFSSTPSEAAERLARNTDTTTKGTTEIAFAYLGVTFEKAKGYISSFNADKKAAHKIRTKKSVSKTLDEGNSAFTGTQPFIFETANFTACFRSDVSGYDVNSFYRNVTASSGQIQFFGDQINLTGSVRCDVRINVPIGMIVMFNLVDINLPCENSSFLIYQLSNLNPGDLKYTYCGKNMENQPAKVYVISSEAAVSLRMSSLSRDFIILVNFTAIPDSDRPHLELTNLSEKSGYITSPDWDGFSICYPSVDAWLQLLVPSEHVIMVTFLDLDLKAEGSLPCDAKDYVAIMKGSNSSNAKVQTVCGQTSPSPAVYNTNAVYIHFHTREERTLSTGFRLFFSFHLTSAVPQQLSDGRWNCSVPHWQDFRQHFPCNLVWDCAAGEDEETCPYYSPLCHPGYFHLRGSCYIYVKAKIPLSWYDASSDCQRQGAHLLSLNEETEWRNLTSLLRQHDVGVFYVGLYSAPLFVPKMYSDTYQWADGTVAYLHDVRTDIEAPVCSLLNLTDFRSDEKDSGSHLVSLLTVLCDVQQEAFYVCEMHVASSPTEPTNYLVFDLQSSPLLDSNQYVTCSEGYSTHRFLLCATQRGCRFGEAALGLTYSSPMIPSPPMFSCSSQIQRVSYSLVCDYRADCSDQSDEDFCTFSSCAEDFFQCGNKQCIPVDQHCDGVEQCVTRIDEQQCKKGVTRQEHFYSPLPPGIVQFDGRGNFTITPLRVTSSNSSLCPDTHFLCPGPLFYCLPVYVRCNGVYDCPGIEDEAACDVYTCPGFYRCRNSHTCLHPAHLCDGIFQCPQHDDELLCNATCPDTCTCFGRAFFCTGRFPVHLYPDLRFLENRNNCLTQSDLNSSNMLIHLSMVHCGLWFLDLPTMINLRSLDLSDNFLAAITDENFIHLTRLTALSLAGNPLILDNFSIDRQFPSLLVLDLSRVDLKDFNVRALTAFPNVQTVNLSGAGINRILGDGFQFWKKLNVLDLRGCPATDYPRHVFWGLAELQVVYADNYKLCCSALLPEGFNGRNCLAPADDISSCEALLRSDVYRVILVLFAILALIGNTVSFVFRAVSGNSNNFGFGVMVTHLCVSDFLMGAYLAVIGVADRLYQGTYLWKDAEWKHSTACKVAGFLSLLSNEVSAFIICLITLDRFLVLRFPFSSLHFHKGSAHLACIAVWCVGLVIAAVPLLPMTSHWEYYSQTRICIPLPITKNDYDGEKYSFGIMIVLNFVLFVLIALGQLVIYWSIRTNRFSSADTSRKSKDLIIARRLITVVMSDFVCYFPIGLLGLLSVNGLAIPREVNVAIAIIALPFNSALNPFLYTVNVIMERRQRIREERHRNSSNIS